MCRGAVESLKWWNRIWKWRVFTLRFQVHWSLSSWDHFRLLFAVFEYFSCVVFNFTCQSTSFIPLTDGDTIAPISAFKPAHGSYYRRGQLLSGFTTPSRLFFFCLSLSLSLPSRTNNRSGTRGGREESPFSSWSAFSFIPGLWG